jgi:hypothetical protein
VISQLSKNTWPRKKKLKFPRALPLLDLILLLKCQNLVIFKYATILQKEGSKYYDLQIKNLHTHTHIHTHTHTLLIIGIKRFLIISKGKDFCFQHSQHWKIVWTLIPLYISSGNRNWYNFIDSNLATSIKHLKT